MAAVDVAISTVILPIPGVIVWYLGRSFAGRRDEGAFDAAKVILVGGLVSNLIFAIAIGVTGVETSGMAGVLERVYALDPGFISAWLGVSLGVALMYALLLIYEIPKRVRKFLHRGRDIERYTDPEWTRFLDEADYARVYLSGDADESPLTGNVRRYTNAHTNRELVLSTPWKWDGSKEDFSPLVPTPGSSDEVWPDSKVLIPDSQIRYITKVPVPGSAASTSVVTAAEDEVHADSEDNGRRESGGGTETELPPSRIRQLLARMIAAVARK